MALARARPIYGSEAGCAAVQAIVDETLKRPRDRAKLVADAAKMRSDMAQHKPAASPFDVKLVDGGLVDCEFSVHVLQLAHGVGLDTRLDVAVTQLVEAGLLDPGVIEARRLLTRMLVTQRLVSPDSTEPPEASKPLVARACGQRDWPSLVEALEAARALIGAEWRRISKSDQEV